MKWQLLNSLINPHFGQLEEVDRFLLWQWRSFALVTADADNITAVSEIHSIAQTWRKWVRAVRFRIA